MNIIQQHRNIKARLDQIRTPRFKTWQMDGAINATIDEILRYKVSGVVENGKRVSFQKTKILRDELYTIVKKRTTIGQITIENYSGPIVAGETITGLTSAATAVILSISGLIITFRYTSVNPNKFFAASEGIDASGGGSADVVSLDNYPILIDVSNDLITYFPGSNSVDTDVYRYLLLLKITLNGSNTAYCIPISHDDKPNLETDPYMRPSQDYPQKFYYVENSEGIELDFANGGSDSISYAEIEYIAQPAVVNYGTEITSVTSAYGADKAAIVVDITIYNPGSGAVIYQPGDEFTLISGTQLTAGKAVVDFTNTDLPISLQEEIVKQAAIRLNMDVENFNKVQIMEQSDQLDKK